MFDVVGDVTSPLRILLFNETVLILWLQFEQMFAKQKIKKIKKRKIQN
jgi:hypothetical protein